MRRRDSRQRTGNGSSGPGSRYGRKCAMTTASTAHIDACAHHRHARSRKTPMKLSAEVAVRHKNSPEATSNGFTSACRWGYLGASTANSSPTTAMLNVIEPAVPSTKPVKIANGRMYLP